MPPRQIDMQGLLNSISGFSSTFTGIADRQLREKARSDLLNMQANFEIESKRFMNEMQASNDYDNWKERYDQFIKQQGDLMQKQSKNQYTAKMANEMLQGYAVNLQKKIETNAFAAREKDIFMQNNNTKELYKDIYQGQEYVDKASNIDNLNVIAGRITPENYEANLISNYNVAYAQHFTQTMDDDIQNAIAKGDSLESLLNKVDSDNFRPTLKAVNYGSTTIEDYESGKATYRDITNSVNFKKNKEDVKKLLTQKYNVALKTMQSENNQHFADVYTQVMDMGMNGDLMGMLRGCKMAIRSLDTEYTGNKLDAGQKKSWTDAFYREINILEKGLGKNGSGNASSTKKELFSNFIKYLPERALEAVANGTYDNLHEAKEAYTKLVRDYFFSGDWSETDGLTEQQKIDYYNSNYANWGERLLNNDFIDKQLNSNPKFATVRDMYKSVCSDIAKNKDMYTPNAASFLGEFTFDLVASTGQEVTEEQLKNMESMINACRLDKADKIISGNLQERLLAAEGNDLVFTDRSGKEHFASGQKEKLTQLGNDLASEMSKQTGIDVAFTGNFQKVPNDTTSIPILVGKNGEQYTPRIKKNDKGKAKGIEYVDSKGNVVGTSTMKLFGTTSGDVKQKKEAKAAKKEVNKKLLEYDTMQSIDDMTFGD